MSTCYVIQVTKTFSIDYCCNINMQNSVVKVAPTQSIFIMEVLLLFVF